MLFTMPAGKKIFEKEAQHATYHVELSRELTGPFAIGEELAARRLKGIFIDRSFPTSRVKELSSRAAEAGVDVWVDDYATLKHFLERAVPRLSLASGAAGLAAALAIMAKRKGITRRAFLAGAAGGALAGSGLLKLRGEKPFARDESIATTLGYMARHYSASKSWYEGKPNVGAAIRGSHENIRDLLEDEDARERVLARVREDSDLGALAKLHWNARTNEWEVEEHNLLHIFK